MKSTRDIVLQFAGQLVVYFGVRYGVIPEELSLMAQAASIAIMPFLYRGLRGMDNGIGKFIRDADPPSSTPN